MSNKKGFTLMEIIVALVILGILSAISVPFYTTMIMQGSAKAAQNNLITIYNGQKNYYYDHDAHCIATCNSLANINTNLSLNITDNNFNYACAANASGFACTATNKTLNTFTLTVNNTALVLPGGASPLNPSCTYAANPSYCPTS